MKFPSALVPARARGRLSGPKCALLISSKLFIRTSCYSWDEGNEPISPCGTLLCLYVAVLESSCCQEEFLPLTILSKTKEKPIKIWRQYAHRGFPTTSLEQAGLFPWAREKGSGDPRLACHRSLCSMVPTRVSVPGLPSNGWQKSAQPWLSILYELSLPLHPGPDSTINAYLYP